MTTDAKLEILTRLSSNLYDSILLLALRVDGLHIGLEQTLLLLESKRDDSRRVQAILTLKALIRQSREEPTAQELLEKPADDLRDLGIEVSPQSSQN